MLVTRMAATLALVLASVPGLSAQADSARKEKKLHWSILGGANFSTLTGIAADTAGLTSRVGPAGAIGLDLELSHRFALAVEAGIGIKGAKQPTVTDAPGLGYQLLYLEFPLLVKFNLAPSAGFRPILLAGPSISFELDCKFPFLYVGTVVTSNCYNLEYERETTELGWQAGIEVHRGKWFITGRYMAAIHGLLVDEAGHAPELKNSGFLLGLGITF